MAVTGGKYWVLVDDEPIVPDTPGPEIASLLAFDSDSGEVVSERSLDGFPSHIIADESAVWVAHWGTGGVTRIDPQTGEVVAQVDVELPFDIGSGPDKRLFIPNDLALGHGSLWVSTARGALARIDVETNDVEMIELEPAAPGEIAVDADGIWIAEQISGARHVDAETRQEIQIALDELDHSVTQILVVGDDLYVVGDRLARTEDGVFRIDAGSYLAAYEYSVSRIDLTSMTVTDSAVLQIGALFLGWIDGRPGIVDATGVFQELEPAPGFLGELFHTNLGNGWPLAPVGRQTWEVDNADSLLRRLELAASAGFDLPFAIDDDLEPRPIPEEIATSPDWIALDRGPVEPRLPAVAVWTGDEIVIWGGDRRSGSPLEGGAAYSPSTDTWRMMSDSPLGTITQPGWVWTGEELIIWDGRGEAAAWEPDANSWRVIDDWPLAGWFYRRSVWTGEEILDVFRDLAVDPETGASRPISDSPPLHQRGSVVWAGGHMVSITGEGSYHLASDSWSEMPPSGLTPLAVDGTAIGSEIAAVDYAMRAAIFDPGANTWSALPDVPLRFFECTPRTHDLGNRVLVEHCAGLAVLDPSRESWTALAHPLVGDQGPQTVIAAGEDIYLWGTGFYRLKADAIDNPSRLAVGVSLLDLPTDWSLTQVREADTTAEITVRSPEDALCLVSERHLGAVGHLRLLMRHDPTVTEVHPYVGGEPANALLITSGKLDELNHLVWAPSTSDVVDVACEDVETLNRLAPRIWSPWQ